MKRLLVFALAALAFAALSGCSKHNELDELEPVTLESLGVPAQPQAMTQDTVVPAVSVTEPAVSKELMPLPPQGPYKPTDIEIQTALKNAGFYAGNIDGKIGPKSKKAIEDFQSANGLKVDGKVGPQTWGVLAKYLNISSGADRR
ncbi:MAG: peptidoglycan-binding protein [Candidatus Omnitrophica bacterium]|nr:peptidoglycan-binding protein [Candidatus Omnitrophota bacterium]MDD5771389.1 peptidoglycan-binding protein [Candidatus Omnitrophota bacterium]